MYRRDENGEILKDEKGKPIVARKMKKKDALTLKLLEKAIAEGDMQAIKEVINRIDGMPTQSVVTGDEEANINTRIASTA